MDAINYWRYNSSPCLQTLSSIDSGVLVALAIIDLLKPYFLIIGGCTFVATWVTGLHEMVVNYSHCILKHRKI